MTASDPAIGAHIAQCPACMQITELREESAFIGTEVLCRECGAILAVRQTTPLVLIEIDPDEFV